MSNEAGELLVPIRLADVERLVADARRAGEEAAKGAGSGLDKQSKTVSEKMSSVGNKASLMLTLPIVYAAKKSIDAASDVIESQNKVQVVFGESADVITTFASRSATDFGISKGAALDATGTFGNLFRALGIGTAPAADLSVSLTTLAGDLASFNNVDSASALEALRSGLLGEAEPLRKFGVSLSAARIDAEAAADGMVKSVKDKDKIVAANNAMTVAVKKLSDAQKKHGKDSIEAKTAQDGLTKAETALEKATKGKVPALDAATKAQAAYKIIMKDTTLAQGDFQRSLSTSAANQARVNGALASDAQAALGANLMPAYQNALVIVGKVTTVFAHMSAGQQQALIGVGLGLAALGPALKVMSNMSASYGHAAKAAKLLFGENGKLTPVLGKVKDTIGQLGKSTLDGVKAFAKMAVEQAKQAVLWVAHTAKLIAHKAVQLAITAATKAWAAAQWLLNVALNANPISLIIIALVAFAALLVVLWMKSETFRNVIKKAFDAVLGAVQSAWNWIKSNWPLLLAILTGPIGLAILQIVKHWDTIKTKVGEVKQWIVDKMTAVVGFIAGLPGKIASAASGMWDGIKNAFRSALNWLIDKWNGLQLTLPSVDTHLPGIGTVGGFTIGTPDIPRFAEGAIVKARPGGIMANIGEGNESEVVSPLSKLPGLLRAMNGQDGKNGRDKQPVQVIVNPRPDQSEAEIGRIAANEIGWRLRFV